MCEKVYCVDKKEKRQEKFHTASKKRDYAYKMPHQLKGEATFPLLETRIKPNKIEMVCSMKRRYQNALLLKLRNKPHDKDQENHHRRGIFINERHGLF